MTSQFVDMTSFVSLAMFSYWSKLYVNIITGSGVMAALIYKRLTRNPKIWNTPAWVLPIIWILKQTSNTRFGKDIYNEKLLHAGKCQGYSFCCFWVIKGKPAWGKIRKEKDEEKIIILQLKVERKKEIVAVHFIEYIELIWRILNYSFN